MLGPHLTRIACLAVWFFGFSLFVYALLSALAATMAVFRFTQWTDEFNQVDIEQEPAGQGEAGAGQQGARVAEGPPVQPRAAPEWAELED